MRAVWLIIVLVFFVAIGVDFYSAYGYDRVQRIEIVSQEIVGLQQRAQEYVQVQKNIEVRLIELRAILSELKQQEDAAAEAIAAQKAAEAKAEKPVVTTLQGNPDAVIEAVTE